MLRSSEKRKLVALRKEFPGQSARDLRMAANREHNMELTLKQVKDWLETIRGDKLNKGKEALAPRQMYRGAVAAEGLNERWQADLAIMPEHGGYIGFLLVVDVFSRKAHAEPVQNKQARTLLSAFREIFESELQLDGRDGSQLTLTTDSATEFAGDFRRWCEERGIIWRQRQPGAKNDIAVCDAAMRYIKHAIAEMEKANDVQDWPRFLPAAVKQNNVRSTGAHGRPEDVAGPHAETQNFLMQQDNARRFDQNDRVSASKEMLLAAAGKFRPPVLPTHHNFGERIGVADYGPRRSVDSLGPGVVYDKHGGEHPLKLIQIVGPWPKYTKKELRNRIHTLPGATAVVDYF